MTFFEKYCPLAADEARPAFMGILNLTPDSFSDGGTHNATADAVRWAEKLLADGADLLDLGAESTRPGFSPDALSLTEEAARLRPALREIRRVFPAAVLSVDTRHAETAKIALAEGADIINDQSALADPAMPPLLREHNAGIVLMHGFAQHIGRKPRILPDSGLAEWVRRGLFEIRDSALCHGLRHEQLCFDPGFGFGLKRDDNFEVLHATDTLAAALAPFPLLIGPSRKHFLALRYPDCDTDSATSLFCREAVRLGAKLLRIHNVRCVRTALQESMP